MAEAVESPNKKFPYAETGQRDLTKSVGQSVTGSVHSETKKTTYVRDYTPKKGSLTDKKPNFKAGVTGPKPLATLSRTS